MHPELEQTKPNQIFIFTGFLSLLQWFNITQCIWITMSLWSPPQWRGMSMPSSFSPPEGEDGEIILLKIDSLTKGRNTKCVSYKWYDILSYLWLPKTYDQFWNLTSLWSFRACFEVKWPWGQKWQKRWLDIKFAIFFCKPLLYRMIRPIPMPFVKKKSYG